MAVGFDVSSSITGSNEMLGFKSLHISHVNSMKDRALKFHQIAHEEEMLHNVRHLIFIRCYGCIHVSTGVHWSALISIVITPQMNR